jgi:hypothetical protein
MMMNGGGFKFRLRISLFCSDCVLIGQFISSILGHNGRWFSARLLKETVATPLDRLKHKSIKKGRHIFHRSSIYTACVLVRNQHHGGP